MALLPFLIVSSCRIVYRLVFRAVPILWGGSFCFRPAIRPAVCSSRRASRVSVSLSGQQYASRRSAFCRHIGRQTEALRRHADKQIALWHGHHLVRHAVLPVCGVVRGVEAFALPVVDCQFRASFSSVRYWAAVALPSEHISGVLVEIR